MLIFTNRTVEANGTSPSAFTRSYPLFSDALSCAQATRNSAGKWKLSALRKEVSDADALAALQPLLASGQRVLIYVHGNNNDPQDCMVRCADLERYYGVQVVGFSWPSEGALPDGAFPSPGARTGDEEALGEIASPVQLQETAIQRKATRYAQAKTNAHQGKEALERFLRLVATARLLSPGSRVSAAFHSLGCHYLHYAVDLGDAESSLAAFHNVALLAGCTGATKHAGWVQQIHPVLKVFITYTKADSVLFGARIVDGDTKLGTAPGPDRLSGPKYRYIDFENAAPRTIGAHQYFVPKEGKRLSKAARLLFSRMFRSELDFEGDREQARQVYPLGCSADGSVCYMAWVDTDPSGP
ncbi:MAG: alpha/beta hydrolase [Hydrogenophaga sp.]|nr:alpha/beta hydrolase [Hydrogenophaga sp.]